MSLDPELWLQQCRIYQNKDQEAITLPYADDDNFYKTLDSYVFKGTKINIFFSNAKLAKDSLFIERIMSCLNGQTLIDDYKNIYSKLHTVLEYNHQEKFIETIMQCSKNNIKIYSTYLFKYGETVDGKPILSFEPAGEGLPSSSFTVDL